MTTQEKQGAGRPSMSRRRKEENAFYAIASSKIRHRLSRDGLSIVNVCRSSGVSRQAFYAFGSNKSGGVGGIGLYNACAFLMAADIPLSQVIPTEREIKDYLSGMLVLTPPPSPKNRPCKADFPENVVKNALALSEKKSRHGVDHSVVMLESGKVQVVRTEDAENPDMWPKIGPNSLFVVLFDSGSLDNGSALELAGALNAARRNHSRALAAERKTS